MATNSDRTVKSVTYYQPGPVPIIEETQAGQFGGVSQSRFPAGYTGDTSLDHVGTMVQAQPWKESYKLLGEYLRNELKQLGDVLFNQATFRLERTNAIPDRPRAGDIRYFDGTNADPLGCLLYTSPSPRD